VSLSVYRAFLFFGWGALPAPPRQCWPHRHGVRQRLDRTSRSCGRRAHLGRAFCVRELAGMPERESLRKERMTQRVSQSKWEFAPSLIFLSMAPKTSRAKIQAAPTVRPHAFPVLAQQVRSRCLSATRILPASQMHKTDAEEGAGRGVRSPRGATLDGRGALP
jgi:hypothetical protein